MPSNGSLKRLFFCLVFGMNAHSKFGLHTGKKILPQSIHYHRYDGPEERIAVDQQKNGQQIGNGEMRCHHREAERSSWIRSVDLKN
jgi:hypothetical protein